MQNRIKSVTITNKFYAFLKLFYFFDGILRFVMYPYALDLTDRLMGILRFMMYSYALLRCKPTLIDIFLRFYRMYLYAFTRFIPFLP
mgnify:FL=1|jgi:hypothetical protein